MKIDNSMINNQVRQILPALDAVVRYIPANSTSNDATTSLISELLIETLFDNSQESWIQLIAMHKEMVRVGNSRDHYRDRIEEFIKKKLHETENKIVKTILEEGLKCSLLQPDGNGWQKGTLKICFEFIPEEIEPVATQAATVDCNSSPLDDIRKTMSEVDQ